MADCQINVGENTTFRKREFEQTLHQFYDSLVQNNVDILVVTGDVFERAKTTELERTIWAGFVHKCLAIKPTFYFIVIDGNHDVRKRNVDYFDGVDTAKYVNTLQEIHTAINNPRYLYNQRSGIFGIGEYPNLLFAAWSELAKTNSDYGDASPWGSKGSL
jgi:DNA repair exonuclease SbcCD nuclease subunit